MRFIFLYIVLPLSIALVVASFLFGGSIPFKQQWALYETLRTTASIVLAIMAAWVAIIYPERLKLFKGNNKNSEHLDTSSRFAIFLQPIINSLIILCIVLLIGILAPIFSQIEILKQYSTELRQLSYSFLTLLTLCQIYTVLTVFVPIHLIKQDNDTLMTRNTQIEAMRARTSQK